MKAKTSQEGSGDAPKPPRVSARIAEQKKRPSKQANLPAKPLAPKAARKRPTELKEKTPRPKRTATTKAKQTAKEKDKRTKHPKALTRKIRGETLQEHERRTANDPLPRDLEKFKSDRVAPSSDELGDTDDEMSTYDPSMPTKLTRCGMFDEKWFDDKIGLKKPDNLQSILNGISSFNNDSGDKAQWDDYKKYVSSLLAPSYSEDMAGDLLTIYLGIPLTELQQPHYKERNLPWRPLPPDSQVKDWKPKPDYAEGIIADQLPVWILDHPDIGTYVNPDSDQLMALPNFMAELKGKGYMKIAHQQARLDGGVAAQALFKLYNHLETPEKCWGQALVGSLEFNGEVMIGNVHWASKPTSNTRDADYHMCRIMCHFTRELGFEGFVKNRAEARSFRQYFANVRRKILKELQGIPQPPTPPKSYDKMSGKELRDLCRERNIPQGKNDEMRKRLKLSDPTITGAVSSAASGNADSPASATNRLTPAERSPNATSPLTPRAKLKRPRVDTEVDIVQNPLPSKKHKG